MEAWIKVYHDLSDHPKTYALAEKLNVKQYAAVGLVVSLWIWALVHAPDGDLGKFPDSAVARACHWDKSPSALVKALVECRWMDGRRLHDWDEYAGALIENATLQKEKARKRVEAFRARRSAGDPLRNADVTHNETVTPPLQDEACNAHVTRYNSVTPPLRNADVTPRAREEQEQEQDIYITHTDIDHLHETHAREKRWFDPENPDEDCDTGWLSDKGRGAVAQRILDWACKREGFSTVPEEDEYGQVGLELYAMIAGAMRNGVHPATITKALTDCDGLASAERQVAALVKSQVGIDGLRTISEAWGERAWAEYQAELQNAAAWM